MTVTPGQADASVTIRQAEQADLLDVFRIESASFPQPWPFSSFLEFVGEESFLVADDGDDDHDVVGYVVADAVTQRGRRLGHVKDLAVHPDRRGEGIGRRLLSGALSGLTRRGLTHAKLEVRPSNESAIALYEDEGFEYYRTVNGYYADGENAYVLVCDLQNRQGL